MYVAHYHILLLPIYLDRTDPSLLHQGSFNFPLDKDYTFNISLFLMHAYSIR